MTIIRNERPSNGSLFTSLPSIALSRLPRFSTFPANDHGFRLNSFVSLHSPMKASTLNGGVIGHACLMPFRGTIA